MGGRDGGNLAVDKRRGAPNGLEAGAFFGVREQRREARRESAAEQA